MRILEMSLSHLRHGALADLENWMLEGRPPAQQGEVGKTGVCDTLVFFLGSPWQPEAIRWNRDCRRRGVSGLVVTPISTGAIVGPLHLGSLDGCLECLQTQRDLGALDELFCSPADATQEAATRSLMLGKKLLEGSGIVGAVGRIFRLQEEGRILGSAPLARFSNCPTCSPAPFPAEIYYATQLFKRSERGVYGPGTV